MVFHHARYFKSPIIGLDRYGVEGGMAISIVDTVGVFGVARIVGVHDE